jgi:two-component system response regulator DesR
MMISLIFIVGPAIDAVDKVSGVLLVAALAGFVVLGPALAAAALAEGERPLTPRETEVLGAARGGEPVMDLAGHLHLSAGTVRNYLSSAMQKLGAHSRAEAVRVAEDKGWL